MLPDRVSNPGPLTYESGALPIALRSPAVISENNKLCLAAQKSVHIKWEEMSLSRDNRLLLRKNNDPF